MWRALVATSLVACGARTDLGGARRVSANDAGGCDRTKPFTSVVAISELNAASGAAELRLSQDELAGYFYRGSDVYVTHRASIALPFSAPIVAADVSTPSFDADPFLSADGLSIYVNSNRPGAIGDSDIFVATRATSAAPFGPATPVANVNSKAYDGTPYVTNDGELWLASSRDGPIHLYLAHASGAGFAEAAAVAELDGPSSIENNPVLTSDGLTIYFSSNRSGPTEIYVAHRDSMTDHFSSPKLVNELSSGSDYASWISVDSCRLYMTRGAGAGFAIYVASR